MLRFMGNRIVVLCVVPIENFVMMFWMLNMMLIVMSHCMFDFYKRC